MTSEEPEWDPSFTSFKEQEEATVDTHGRVHDAGDRENRRFISSVGVSQTRACDFANRNTQCSAMLTDIDPNLHDNYFLSSLKANVKVASTKTSKRQGTLTPERLSRNWCISLEAAKKTLYR
jgi:hypothetical protein